MFSFRSLPPAYSARTLAVVLLCGAQFIPLIARSAPKRPTPRPTPSTAASASPTANYVIPDPVAKVDGEPIRSDDLERVANVLLASKGKTLQTLGAAEKQKVAFSVLGDMITDRLVNREVANEAVDPVEVEKRFSELIAQYPTRDAFDAEVKKSGQTADQVRQNLRGQIAQQQWIEHQIVDQVKVSPEQVEKFYKEGPSSKFDSPEMVRASHILVAARRDAPPEEVLAAEQKIDALAARVRKGESFDELAKANSDDPSTKTAKIPGDLGYFSRERIMPEFADAAFKLKTGEVSAPVRTQFGFHLIKLTDRKPAKTATFAEAHDQIATYIQDEKRRLAVAALVASLRGKARIEVLLP